MAWVRFHEELTQGTKRGFPRSVRFILMELSLKARPLGGSIELACGMSDLDAVHDLLGGNRAEIEEAMRLLCEGDDPVVVFVGSSPRRLLTIPSWERWNPNGADSNAATTRKRNATRNRVQRYRERQRNARAQEQNINVSADLQPETQGGNAQVTPVTPPRVREREREDQIPPVCVDQGPENNARAQAAQPATLGETILDTTAPTAKAAAASGARRARPRSGNSNPTASVSMTPSEMSGSGLRIAGTRTMKGRQRTQDPA